MISVKWNDFKNTCDHFSQFPKGREKKIKKMRPKELKILKTSAPKYQKFYSYSIPIIFTSMYISSPVTKEIK